MAERADGRPVNAKVAAAWERVKSAEMPAFTQLITARAANQRLDDQRRLAMLCFELSKQYPSGFFLLGSLDAAAVMDVGQTNVSYWLRQFVELKLIVRHRRGDSRTGMASSYKWIHGRIRRRKKAEPELAT